ncbi:MAG: hypothetical protein B7733_05800 [Myxococcales bacterium FL481]|nr:MAG: hypothetical protein B7733_05800 [Myxococcales bacterium FL481]
MDRDERIARILERGRQLKRMQRDVALEKARRSLLGYTLHVVPNYIPSSVHRVICDKLDMVLEGLIRRLLILMPPRHGKALREDEEVQTPRGWTKIGDLSPGDHVFGPDGLPTKVVAVRRFENRPCYRVVSDDGASLVVDENHDWTVRLCRKRARWSVRSTKYLADRTSPRRPLIPTYAPVHMTEADLPIDPYVLGVWLGDGRSSGGTITIDPTDQWHVRKRFHAAGQQTTDHSISTNFGVPGLQAKLGLLGLLDNKHVPGPYLVASIKQRQALLQGLIDTDGYVAQDGQVEFCNTNRQLAVAVRELVHSLGTKASWVEGRATLDGRDCGPKYRVMFYMAGAASLPRKASRCRDGVKHPGRFLSFEKVENANTVCIQVYREDGLFLAGRGYMVTHNSTLASQAFPAYVLGKRPETKIMATAYSEGLASDQAREVRRNLKSLEHAQLFGHTIVRRSRDGLKDDETIDQARHFTTSAGGSYYCDGLRGTLTGKGYHIGVLDDPYKNREEADSATIRKRTQSAYDSAFLNRGQPRPCGMQPAIVMILTPWHHDGLQNYVIRKGKDSGLPWEVIDMPAILDREPCAGDTRQQGEALCPERIPLSELQMLRASMDPREWAALYQTRPVVEGGELFPMNAWKRFDWGDLR